MSIDDGLTKSQRYRLKNLEAYRARKALLARSPEQRTKRTAYNIEWHKRNPGKHLEYQNARYKTHGKELNAACLRHYYKKKYGLTPEQAAELRKQPCDICGKHKNVMSIDHDHQIPEPSYRGVLCFRCNTHLGWVESVGTNAIFLYLNGKKTNNSKTSA